jgi:hypothetical protein
LPAEPGSKKVLENPDLEHKRAIVANEIDGWINLIMDIILNTVRGSDLISRVLEESDKSCYMKEMAAEKVILSTHTWASIPPPCLYQP